MFGHVNEIVLSVDNGWNRYNVVETTTKTKQRSRRNKSQHSSSESAITQEVAKEGGPIAPENGEIEIENTVS